MVSRLRWLAVAGLAWVGIALGHLATCALVDHEHGAMFPSPHSWVPFGAVVAIASIPAVVAVAAMNATRAERPFPAMPTAAVLAGIQLPLFIALEVFERVAAPGPFAMEPAVLLGVAMQLVVVLLGVALLTAVVRVARALAGRTAPQREPIAAHRGPPATNRRPAHLLLLVGSRRRAPPLPLAA